MLRDISSFGNASGGFMIVGMQEDEEGRAIKIKGVENAEEEVRRITGSCLANIKERILGLKIRPIPTKEGKDLIVLSIPRSTSAPHMVTFQGLNQFWKRYGTMKNRMSVEEIKEACQTTMNLRRSLEDFLSERKEKVIRDIARELGPGEPFLYISATPLIVKDEFLNIFDTSLWDLLENPPYSRQSGWYIGRGEEIRPSLYGLVGHGRPDWKLEVFRNAHVEFRVRIENVSFCRKTWKHKGKDQLLMYPYPLCEYPLSFLNFVNVLYGNNGVLDPCVLTFSLYHVRDFGLAEDIIPHGTSLPRFWPEDHLEIPPFQVSLPVSTEKTAQILANRVWNAFGF